MKPHKNTKFNPFKAHVLQPNPNTKNLTTDYDNDTSTENKKGKKKEREEKQRSGEIQIQIWTGRRPVKGNEEKMQTLALEVELTMKQWDGSAKAFGWEWKERSS